MTTKAKKAYRREPHEIEEEKCEIQPPSYMVPTRSRRNILNLTYAPNVTPPITDANPVIIHAEVKDKVEKAASDNSEGGSGSGGGGDGKEDVVEALDDNSQDASITDDEC